MWERFKRLVFGGPRDIHDPHLFHQVSLVAFLAWIGLGADGLSSSAYGPDEAFRALGPHTYLAIWLALATAVTVFVISYAYSRIIEHFPGGGGGYVVASKLLGSRWGVVSGSALLVDYMLTITVSIASGGDAIFSFLPPAWVHYKLTVEVLTIGLLIVLNLRGVRESITVLMPIFVTFLITHAIFIAAGCISRANEVGAVVHEVRTGTAAGLSQVGFWGLFLIFIRAYSLGGGTYTGIEAVSNGLQIMREPKVQTAQRTMVYMATSLAVTAGGIILVYMLAGIHPVEGKTMNALALESIFGKGAFGSGFVVLSLVSEGALLFVAAQTGFIDGPRVMANMAVDSWFPHRFSALSDRLTMKNGVLLMGSASLVLLLITRGSVDALVVMYSINVFITFSLSELGMVRFYLRHRKTEEGWKQHISVHLTGLTMCASILFITLFEKFSEGGWLTLVITLGVIALCFLIRWHYRRVLRQLQRLNEILSDLPTSGSREPPAVDPAKPTAVLLVADYGGLGVHSLLNIQRAFPGYFQNFVFVSVGVIDSANFKGAGEVERLQERTAESLARYVDLAHRLGLAAERRMAIGTEVVEATSELCEQIAREFPHAVVFGGKLIFQEERWYHRILHNETAHAIQKRVQFAGLPMVVLPVRVRESDGAGKVPAAA
ncbi:MAG: APC family permease [Myxococcales bacterium]